MNQKTGIAGSNHALLCGQIMGMLNTVRTQRPDLKLLAVEALMEDSEYTNEIRVTKPSGTYIVAVYPENATED